MDPQLATIIERAKAERLGDDVIRSLIVEHERRTGGTPPIVATRGMISQSTAPRPGESFPATSKVEEEVARSGNANVKNPELRAALDAADLESGIGNREALDHPVRAAVELGANLALPGVIGAATKYARPFVPAIVNKIADVVEKPLVGGVLGAYEGYKRGGVTGALELGAAGMFLGSKIPGVLRKSVATPLPRQVPITPGPGTTMTGMSIESLPVGGMSGTTTPTLRPSIEPALRPRPLPTSATGLSPLEAAAAQPNMMGPRVATPAPVPLRPSVTGTGSVTAGAPPTTGIDTEAWMRSMRGRLPATVEPVSPPVKPTPVASPKAAKVIVDTEKTLLKRRLDELSSKRVKLPEDWDEMDALNALLKEKDRVGGAFSAGYGKWPK